ncbi:MAG: type II toxin-antitoxin system VapC family toxin [Candidatus Hodarchaeales archaeon]|jgi:predicted nucleic acid-binding protein
MKFLDTSFLIDVLRKYTPAKTLLDDLDKEGPHVTNTIVAHEFLVGGYGTTNSEMELKARNGLLSRIVILDFDLAAANRSAIIEADLRAKGEMIGGADILIAGTMISRGISTLVTKNTRHFEKIPHINIQTW